MAWQISDFRSERFIQTELGWYARTRENKDLGPFVELAQAEQALTRHIQDSQHTVFRNPIDVLHGVAIHDYSHCNRSNCAICAEAQEAALRSSLRKAS